jgi:hypothetical protein
VTEERADKYTRIIYADPPWDYGAHAQPDYQTKPPACPAMASSIVAIEKGTDRVFGSEARLAAARAFSVAKARYNLGSVKC